MSALFVVIAVEKSINELPLYLLAYRSLTSYCLRCLVCIFTTMKLHTISHLHT